LPSCLPQGQAALAVEFGFAILSLPASPVGILKRSANAPFKMVQDIYNAIQKAIVGAPDWNVNLVAPLRDPDESA
jgi:hypothetical protein